MNFIALIIIVTTLYSYVLAILSRSVKPFPYETSNDLVYIFMVPALNEELVIHSTLTTLLALRGNFYVLVLDDASDDRTAEIVKTFQTDPRVLLLERPRAEARTGKGAVLNAGLREIKRLGLADAYGAENVIITVFDADARVEPDYLDGLTPYLQDPQIAGVQSAVRMYNFATNILTFWQNLEFVLWGELFCRAKNRLNSGTLGGNGQSVRLAALANLGDDPWQSTSLTEDLDLSLRLLVNGLHLRFCPSVAVYQEALPGLRRLIRQRSRWVQGHFVCWRYAPGMLKSSLPLYTKLDLLIFMLMPGVLPSVGIVSIWSWLLIARGSGHVNILSLLGVYVLAFNIAPLAALAWPKGERPSLPKALFHTHLFFFNSFVWLCACLGAVWSILKGRRGWAKTSRVSSPATSLSSQPVPTISAPIGDPPIALSPRPVLRRVGAVAAVAALWLLIPTLLFALLNIQRGHDTPVAQTATVQNVRVQHARSRLSSSLAIATSVNSDDPSPYPVAAHVPSPASSDYRDSFAAYQANH